MSRQVTAGDPWPEAIPKHNEDGSVNWAVGGYIAGFTIIVIWVILQVEERVRERDEGMGHTPGHMGHTLGRGESV